ncbi:6745_t:CDS:2 [Racocetra fulgida]|uniref:6745_t:CDS:1 n=1 Tax=Racocetra fulgida TaxID=60492 RepID=A0A9N8VHL8_9GLOM|nr:6745_t:CDS:2 [Racocetra fulgida]
MNKHFKIFIISFLLFFAVHFTGANFNKNGTRPITDDEVEILQRFARYSILAFDGSIQDIVNWTCKVCKDISKDPKNIEVKPVKIPIGDTINFLAYIIVNKQTKDIVITFRGSDFTDPTNTIADIGSFNLVKYKFKGYQPSNSNEDILVSEGFFTTWQLFHSSNLTNELTSLMKKYPSFSVSATGHSLGGGLFQALDIKQNYPDNTKLCFYGYNIPRGGNELFANYVNKELVSLMVPPRPKWVQPKGEVWISDPSKKNFKQGSFVCDGNDNPVNIFF